MKQYIIDRYKLLSSISLVTIFFILSACSGGSTNPTPSPNPNAETLVITSVIDPTLTIGQTTFATLSINNIKANESVVVAITTSNNAITVSPTSCELTIDSNTCEINITANNSGSAVIIASATGLAKATSPVITVSPIPYAGILFGTQNGLVFNDGSILAGSDNLFGVDGSMIQALAVDSNDNMYAGTFGIAYGGAFGAGKVFKYITSAGYWVVMPGQGSGGSLDGSCINALIVDSDNNLYAGTNAGNVFRYENGYWNQVGNNLQNQNISAFALDENNNLYVASTNGEDPGYVYKYANGQWISLGNPDSTGVLSIAISNNSIYAATSGNDGNGQVYKYISGVSWNKLTSFNDGSVNSIIASANNIYAGTGNSDPMSAGKVHMSTNAGNSWTSLGSPDNRSPVTSLILDNTTLYAGTYGDNDNGQVYQYNGTSWDAINTSGKKVNGNISGMIINNDTIYVSTSDNGEFTGTVYQNKNNRWNELGTGSTDGTPIYSITADNSGYYVGTQQNNVFKYSTTYKAWIQIGGINNLGGGAVDALVTYNNQIYAGTDYGNIYVGSTNPSTVYWSQLGNGMDEFVVSDLAINNNNGQLYASLNNSEDSYGIIQSYNIDSDSWTTIAGSGINSSLDGLMIQSITTDSYGNLYAATGNLNNDAGGLVWKYTINNSSWSVVGFGTLDGTSINSVITDSNNNVYAGTSGGNVFKYNGLYWAQINTYPLDVATPGADNVFSVISNLNFDKNGNLYATTFGGFVWEYTNKNNLWVKTNYGIGVAINTTGSVGI